MKTILLPTDFSKNSINAIHYALELYKNEMCHFYLLNIQKASAFISDDMMLVSSSATIYTTLVDTAKKSISNIISSVKEKFNNTKHQFHSIVDYDNFIDSINQVSNKNHIDIIIMGTKGASGLQKVLFGSNTARVMQRCSMPVLAIPNGCSFQKLNKIAFTINHLNLCSLEELQTLKDFVLLNNSALHILHVADEHHSAQNQSQNIVFFNNYFKDAIHEFIDVNSKDMYKAVHDYIDKNDIKMLVMVSEKHSFFERLFTRHALETFAFKIDIPFLVMEKIDL